LIDFFEGILAMAHSDSEPHSETESVWGLVRRLREIEPGLFYGASLVFILGGLFIAWKALEISAFELLEFALIVVVISAVGHLVGFVRKRTWLKTSANFVVVLIAGVFGIGVLLTDASEPDQSASVSLDRGRVVLCQVLSWTGSDLCAKSAVRDIPEVEVASTPPVSNPGPSSIAGLDRTEVYVHRYESISYDQALSVTSALLEAGWGLPQGKDTIDYMDAQKGPLDVRFFFAEDQELAKQLATEVSAALGLNKTIKVKDFSTAKDLKGIPYANRVSAGHLEVWLSQ
jgi:hypothetical protein